MAERILAAGASKVDGVSGATVTSDAVRAAAESALREAGLSKATETKARVGRWVGTAHGAKSELSAEIVVDDAGHIRIEKVASGDTLYVKDFTAIGNAITNAGLGAHNATSLASGLLAGREARAFAAK